MIRATAPIGWATRFSTGPRRISGDRVGNFGDERQSLGQRELPRADVFIQPPPAHQFHREVRLRAQRRLDDPRLVDLGDPGMLQPSEELVFVLEPPEHLRIDEARANDFQREAPPRSILFRFIDDAHRPFANGRHQPVRPNLGAVGRVRILGSVVGCGVRVCGMLVPTVAIHIIWLYEKT